MWRQFGRKSNGRQPPERSEMVQKFELTGSGCENKKGVIRMHNSTYSGQSCSCTWSAASESEKICDTMFPITPYRKEHQHTPSCDEISFCIRTKSKWYRYLMQPTSSGDEPIYASMGLWTSRTRGSEPLKMHTRHSIAQTAPWDVQSAIKDFLEGTITNHQYLEQLQKWVHRACGHNFFSSRMEHANITECHLGRPAWCS